MPIVSSPSSPAAPSPTNVVATPVALPQSQSNLQVAQAILNQLYFAAQNNPTGVTRINIDGQDVQYDDSKQMNAAILFWETRVAILSRRRRRASSICLG